jgi:hypothetical protein
LFYKNQLSRQTGSRNLTDPKTLPTIWGTYMKLVTKYQISAINSCWEKCDEKYLGMDGRYLCPSIRLSFRPSQDIFRRIFLSNYWLQKSDIWSQASYRYPILWEANIRFLPSIVAEKTATINVHILVCSMRIKTN